MSGGGGLTKLIKKVHKFHDPLDLDNKILDPLGLPTINGKENGILPEAQVTGSTVDPSAPGAAPTAVSDDTMAAREAARKRQLAAAGLGGTMLTGAGGLGSASTAGKSLLGS